MQAVLQAAGMTTDDLVEVTVFAGIYQEAWLLEIEAMAAK